jgi:hypothetical protein
MPSVTIAVEGDSDVPVIRKVLTYAGFEVAVVQGRGGKSKIDANLAAYNAAAALQPWLVVRDLDHDASCAPELLAQLAFAPAAWMRFRISVRELESWILADAGAVSRFLRIKRKSVPTDPDSLDDPKLTLLTLAASSPNEAIKADMVQAPGTCAKEGPGYVSRVRELVTKLWSPHVARGRSDSLDRCLQSLESLHEFWED